MFTKNIFAAGALISVAVAVPFNKPNEKRDIAWVTQTQEDIVTMQMTQTVWLEPGETPPTYQQPSSHYGHHHHSQVTSHVQSTVTVAASPSSSSPVAPVESSSSEVSSYVAPSSSSVYVAPSSSSVYVAPTSSSVYVAPTTTSSVYTPPPSSSAAPAPSATGYSGGGSGITGMAASGSQYTGDLTYYAVGMGACGETSTPDQQIVAISEDMFDAYATANPNDNPLCNKQVTITAPNGGQEYTATIVDRCTGCDMGSLDLSEGFFTKFADTSVGRLTGVSWKFN